MRVPVPSKHRVFPHVVASVGCAIALAACSSGSSNQDASTVTEVMPPIYHVGDSLTFEENGNEQPNFVTAIQNDQIYWVDNAGTKWITFADPTIPPLTEIPKAGGVTILRFFSPEKPTVFPLEAGKKISYSVTVSRSDLAVPIYEQHSCEVRSPRSMTVEAGTFDAWEIVCSRNGMVDTYFYAPKIGAVVLKRREAPGATRRLTLADYHKVQPLPEASGSQRLATAGGQSQASAPGTGDAKSSTAASATAATQSAAWSPLALSGWAPAVTVDPTKAPASTAPKSSSTPVSQPKQDTQSTQQESAARQVAAIPLKPTGAAADSASNPSTSRADRLPPVAATDSQLRPTAAAPSVPNTGDANRPTQPPGVPNEETVATTSNGHYVVQLGAYPTYGEANHSWQTMRARIPQVLGDMSPQVETVTTPAGKHLIRLMVGPFSAPGDARKFCSQLQSAKQDCWVRQAS